jgi:hypothetical protein
LIPTMAQSIASMCIIGYALLYLYNVRASLRVSASQAT